MVLELHVWGPFGNVPSIDPECIAAIAYFSYTIPIAEWRLVRSNDPAICPAHLLPALNHDGKWISGFSQIIHHLTTSYTGVWHIDPRLGSSLRADIAAYTTLLTSTIQPLIDASLYVSEENWVAATRPAYAALLPFPLSWLLPHSVRAAAVARAERTQVPRFLELLESDLLDEEQVDAVGGGDDGATVMQEPLTVTQSLASKFKRRTKEQDIKTRVTKQIVTERLAGHVTELLTPFSQMLVNAHGEGAGVSFFQDVPVTSLDCLAYGYFALILDSGIPMPQSFLKDAAEKLLLIQQFVDNIREACLTGPVVLPLPIAAPVNSTSRLIFRCLDEVIRTVPTLGDEYAAERTRREVDGVLLSPRGAALAVRLLMTGLAFGGGRVLFKAAQPFGAYMHVWVAAGAARPNTSRLDGFGPIGSAVGSLLQAQDHARDAYHKAVEMSQELSLGRQMLDSGSAA